MEHPETEPSTKLETSFISYISDREQNLLGIVAYHVYILVVFFVSGKSDRLL